MLWDTFRQDYYSTIYQEEEKFIVLSFTMIIL